MVELVISINIIILILTLCLPTSNLKPNKVNSFVEQLHVDIRYVRKMNILGNRSTYIYFEKDKDREKYILKENGNVKKECYLPTNIDINEYSKKIMFRHDGSPEPRGGTINIIGENIKKSITIVPVSGRVILKEG